MDQETIQRIASEVARHLPGDSWTLLAVQALLTLVAAGSGVFLVEYLRTRGKNLATTADFERLQDQLSAQTKLVETIKSEVSRKDWTGRQWTEVRRIKLDELLSKISECEAYRDNHRRLGVEGNIPPAERDAGADLRSMTVRYFPELQGEVNAYLLLYREMLSDSVNLALELHKAGTDLNSREIAYNAFAASFKTRLPIILEAQSKIDAAAHNLMKQIMDVSE